jgi:hypothetical protein
MNCTKQYDYITDKAFLGFRETKIEITFKNYIPIHASIFGLRNDKNM